MHDDLAVSRETMVERQLSARGMAEPRILDATRRRVPRKVFLSPELREWAYADAALPIAESCKKSLTPAAMHTDRNVRRAPTAARAGGPPSPRVYRATPPRR